MNTPYPQSTKRKEIRAVSFATALITSTWERPTTTPDEKDQLFYSQEDYDRFRADSRREIEQFLSRMNMMGQQQQQQQQPSLPRSSLGRRPSQRTDKYTVQKRQRVTSSSSSSCNNNNNNNNTNNNNNNNNNSKSVGKGKPGFKKAGSNSFARAA